jgi:phosphoribosylformylglycinamidine synthase subunit PurQ / glutaminase
MKKIGVITFPGSNCEQDVVDVYRRILKQEVLSLWHAESDLKNVDMVILPGGFSYGDYLRCGALAKLSSIMESVKDFARSGGQVLGICNGFQILCETGLLPGVLLQNVSMRYLSRFVSIKVEENHCSKLLSRSQDGQIATCPIAHFDGNYFIEAQGLEELKNNNQIVFKYCTDDGEVQVDSRFSNPNGSLEAIAGICNKEGNVTGLMPHPERASDSFVGFIGGDSGLRLLSSVV